MVIVKEEESKMSTIKLSDATKIALDKLKIHPRQSYEEIIKQIIKKQK